MLPNKPVTAVQLFPAKQELTPPPFMASVTQGISSTAQPGLSSNPVPPSISSAEPIEVAGAPGPSFSVSDAQLSPSPVKQLLSTLGSLDATSLQKLSVSDIQTLMFILNKNQEAVATANTPNLEFIASTSNPQPSSAVMQQVSKNLLPSTVGAEMATTNTAVSSEPKLPTYSAPIHPTLFQDPLPAPTADVLSSESLYQDIPMQLNSTTASEDSIQQVNLQESFYEAFSHPSTPVPPQVAEISSDLPILQPDPEMLEEIGLPNTDIVSFADMLLSTSNNLCDNCKTEIKQPASHGVPLPEDANRTAGNSFTPSSSVTPPEVEEELNRQKSDFIRREVDRAIELYRSTHPAPPQNGTSNDIVASTDSYYTLDGCNGMGNIRPLVDLGSLAVTGCVQKSTIYVDMGHLNSKSPFIDPLHPRANTTLAELNQEPVASLDPHHSATAPYHTPSLLDDVDGIPHTDSFTKAIAPVYCDRTYWNDPEEDAKWLQLDLEDIDEILDNVTSVPEQEKGEEEEKQRRLCARNMHNNSGSSNVVDSCHNHTSGKWVTLYPEVVEEGENEQEKQEALIVSIPLNKVTLKSASKCHNRKVLEGKRRSRKRKLEDHDDITGGPEQMKKMKVFWPSSLNSDESETD